MKDTKGKKERSWETKEDEEKQKSESDSERKKEGKE
jgi:hypothetical protein